jgi:hypothetical protein
VPSTRTSKACEDGEQQLDINEAQQLLRKCRLGCRPDITAGIYAVELDAHAPLMLYGLSPLCLVLAQVGLDDEVAANSDPAANTYVTTSVTSGLAR